MFRSRHLRSSSQSVAISTKPNTLIRSTKIGWVYEKRAEVSVRWRGVCGFGFLVSSCFVSCGIVLIGSSSPVSRSSSSSNYTMFSFRLFFVLCLLAFLFSFWLGCAVDHKPHTPTFSLATTVRWSKLADCQAEFSAFSGQAIRPRHCS